MMQYLGAPVIYQDERTLAAGETVNNVVEANRLVQLPRNGHLSLAVNGSATGLRVQMVVGSDEVITDSACNAFNRQIETDKDFMVRGIRVRAGQRVTLKISNPTAGSLTAYWRLVLK
jgi:hypothetical protein